MKKSCFTLAWMSSFILGVMAAAWAQGPLEPPGAPGMTMKTLSQVEPRIPITNVPVTISVAGSYYLTGNLHCLDSGVNGINITAENVTLDLSGFSLIGPGAASGHGIRAGANTHIRNGLIYNWNGNGQFAISLQGNGSTVEGVHIRVCANGIHGSANNHKIENCMIQSISSTSTCHAIHVAHAATIRNTHIANVSGATVAYGIRTGEDAIISECSVWNVSSVSTSGAAIYCSAGALVERCNVNFNRVHGIWVFNGCLVKDNVCRDNGPNGEQVAGITMSGTGNRIMNNHITQNFYGLRGSIGQGTNLVAGNTFLRNNNAIADVNPSINLLGPVQTGVGSLTNHPWANFVVGM